VTLGVVLSLAVFGSAGVVGWTNYKFGQLQRYHVRLVKAAAGEPENFLIAGSDTRAGTTKGSANAGAFLNGQYDAGQRSDSIMVLRLDSSKSSARILSIPRDLYVKYAGNHGSGKINGAFAISPQVLTDTVSQTLGISINHFIQVDFLAFQKLVDAIGGLPIYFDTAMRDRNTGLNITGAGCVKLDGVSALAFARSRHLEYKDAKGRWVGDDANDFGRIKRQQFLVRHAVTRLNSQGYLTDPGELNSLLTAFVDTVKPDQGLGIPQLLNIANKFKKFDAEHLQTFTIPAMRWYPAPDGSDALRMQPSQAQASLNEFRSAAELRQPETSVSVEVLSGSSVENQATNVAGALQAVGFRIVGTGTATRIGLYRQQSRTMVRYSEGNEAAADLVASHLSVAPTMVVDSRVADGEVIVVPGADFTTVQAQAKPTTTTTAPTTTVAGKAPTTTVAGSGTTEVTTTTELGKVPPDSAPAGVDCR
jgi:LCP family protein required for cell wall assembly